MEELMEKVNGCAIKKSPTLKYLKKKHMKQLLASLLLISTYGSFAQNVTSAKVKLPVDQNDSGTVFKTNTVTPCIGGDVTFTSGMSGSSYQWEVDAGSGYTNVSNGGIYSDATTPNLKITGAPSSLYGYKYRCNANGNYSSVYILKFISTWTGTSDNTWENPANWNCNAVPDANTDVIINSGSPVLNSVRSVRTLSAGFSVNVTVKAAGKLTVIK